MICVCGHPRRIHLHFRDGRDCGFCGRVGCPHFRWRRLWWPLRAKRSRP